MQEGGNRGQPHYYLEEFGKKKKKEEKGVRCSTLVGGLHYSWAVY